VWIQREIRLQARSRGFHLVTRELLDALSDDLAGLHVGLAHVFIQHTSASLSLNENASSAVRRDLETWANAAVPEDFAWTHTDEGPDDMPAHVKAALMGASLSIPITSGRLALGTWQGIFLCEHRDHGGPRRLVVTLTGQSRSPA
jgi:secondary thiamine-phosphate synthase enzyme